MFCTLVLVLMISASGGVLSPEENQHLDKLVEDNMVFEFDEKTPSNLAEVLNASLIEVKVINLYDKNGTTKADCWYTTHNILKSDDYLAELVSPNELLPFLAPEFSISSEDNARDFEQMLDVFFPVFFSSGKEILQVEDDWVFIREESFGDKQAIVVTVDGSGRPVAIVNVDGYGNGEEE